MKTDENSRDTSNPAMHPFVARYDTAAFKNMVNSMYTDKKTMKKTYSVLLQYSIDHNKNMADIMKWGSYQEILMGNLKIGGKNEIGKLYDEWSASCGEARTGLAKQPNQSPLFPGSGNVPSTKIALLDQLVAMCFDFVPGKDPASQGKNTIPMVIDVAMRDQDDPNYDQHDIEFFWETEGDTSNKIAKRLFFRMICPCPVRNSTEKKRDKS